MRQPFRVLILIAALLVAASGTLMGAVGVAFSLQSGGPDVVTTVTFSVSVLALSLGFGSVSAWHALRATQGHPSAPFRPRTPWLLFLLFLASSILGQAVLSYSVLPALVFPPLHVAASVLPPLFILAVVGRALQGVTTWRHIVLQVSSGIFLAAPLAMLLETVAIVLIATAAITGLALQPGGEELVVAASSYLQDPALLQNPGILVRSVLTPAIMAAVVVLVAGLIPLVEEVVKTIGVGLMASRRPALPQAVLWGLAAGVGFSIAEGLLNSAGALGAWLATVVLRLGTTILHCFTGALVGVAWYQLFTQQRWARGLGLYLASVAIHGLWNGLAATMAILSVTGTGSGTESNTQLATALWTLGTLILLGVLALGMLGGLAGLTAHARRRVHPSAGLSSQHTEAPATGLASGASPESE